MPVGKTVFPISAYQSVWGGGEGGCCALFPLLAASHMGTKDVG